MADLALMPLALNLSNASCSGVTRSLSRGTACVFTIHEVRQKSHKMSTQIQQRHSQSANSAKPKMWSGIRIRIFRLIRIYIRMSAASVPNVVDSFSCRGVSFVSFPCKKWNSLQGGQVPLYRCCWGGIKWPRAVFSCLVTSSDSKSWYCFQHVCLSVCLCLCRCVCVCVNKSKSGSGDTLCSADNDISGCDYFGRCWYVCLFRWVSKISLALQLLTCRREVWQVCK